MRQKPLLLVGTSPVAAGDWPSVALKSTSRQKGRRSLQNNKSWVHYLLLWRRTHVTMVLWKVEARWQVRVPPQ